MKPSKILPLILLSLIASCKSHKTITDSTYTASDTLSSQTTLQLHSHTEIQTAESISSRQSHDHIEFQDQNGEIQIHPDGKISIKGLKSADLLGHTYYKHSKEIINSKDSLAVQSSMESVSSVSAISASEIVNSNNNSLRLKIILILLLTLILTALWHKSKK